MKNQNEREKYSPSSVHDIPDIEIIDLESEDRIPDSRQDDTTAFSEETDLPKEDPAYEDEESFWEDEGKKPRFRVNMHLVLLATFVIFVGVIVFQFLNWGELITQEEIFKDGPGTYEDTLDQILPLIADSEAMPEDDGETVIVAFGNAPFADARGSEDNLASMIEEMTGATVYNCSVSGSYLAALSPLMDSKAYPMDVFNFYWLCQLAAGADVDGHYETARQVMGDAYPPEGDQVCNTLKSLDFNKVDVITLMYDASDYLAGHEMYSDQNSTDIMQFTGNMEAGIELLQSTYPHIRIIVMSPTYAFAVDPETGEYISSDIFRHDNEKLDVLSTYVIKQYASAATRSVSFVDNLYGTVTEDNAKEYLTDNLHLNTDGRKLVAERFVYALNYYDNSDGRETQ